MSGKKIRIEKIIRKNRKKCWKKMFNLKQLSGKPFETKKVFKKIVGIKKVSIMCSRIDDVVKITKNH